MKRTKKVEKELEHMGAHCQLCLPPHAQRSPLCRKLGTFAPELRRTTPELLAFVIVALPVESRVDLSSPEENTYIY